ncbi:hypothetical protein K443DRAFT_353283 [Laccaria amethystina LaAM-08-1]|uniref:Uncharacterized protein n=1 Tax=Laccaria amethystina LaAM-08-1 TaxID=1095629 RepID=A0A0C9Y5J9_9AGAR|nr:hypothetical protein K443DRAFT_353283 [Laccaria amethystina LaAM-08-1]
MTSADVHPVTSSPSSPANGKENQNNDKSADPDSALELERASDPPPPSSSEAQQPSASLPPSHSDPPHQSPPHRPSLPRLRPSYPRLLRELTSLRLSLLLRGGRDGRGVFRGLLVVLRVGGGSRGEMLGGIRTMRGRR